MRELDRTRSAWEVPALCLAASAALLGTGAAAGLRGSALVVTPLSLALLGLLLATRSAVDRSRLRATAVPLDRRGVRRERVPVALERCLRALDEYGFSVESVDARADGAEHPIAGARSLTAAGGGRR